MSSTFKPRARRQGLVAPLVVLLAGGFLGCSNMSPVDASPGGGGEGGGAAVGGGGGTSEGGRGGGGGRGGSAGVSGGGGTSVGGGGGGDAGGRGGSVGVSGAGGNAGRGGGGGARLECPLGPPPDCRGDAGSGGEQPHGGPGDPPWQAPSCLATLFADCPITGECRWRFDATDQIFYCFASGTHADYVEAGACTSAGRSQIVVTKPDGSPCFTFVLLRPLVGLSCATADYTFNNPAGEVVATGSESTTQAGRQVTVQCSGTGETTSCGPTPACNTGVFLFGSTNCPQAVCFGNP